MSDDVMVRTEDELRWEFYRAAIGAWADSMARAPRPREAPDDAPRRTPR